MATLLALGDEPGGDPDVFNLAHMSLRLCGDANGVSILHGDVSRRMFSPLWPGVEVDDVPIGAVTNGVHAPTFMADDIDKILVDTVGDDWQLAGKERFRAVHSASDASLWAARSAGRAALVEFLIARGAVLDIKDAVYGTTPVVWALHGWLVDRRTPDDGYRRVLLQLAHEGASVQNEWIDDERIRADGELHAALAARVTRGPNEPS